MLNFIFSLICSFKKYLLCTYEPEKVQGVKDIVAREKNNQDVFCVKTLQKTDLKLASNIIKLLSFIFNNFCFILSIFDWTGSSLLCEDGLSSCSEYGLLFVAVLRFLTVVASLVVKHRALGAWRLPWSCGSQALEHGFTSCGCMGSAAPQHMGSSKTRDWTCILHWQADSQSVEQQGSSKVGNILTYSLHQNLS